MKKISKLPKKNILTIFLSAFVAIVVLLYFVIPISKSKKTSLSQNIKLVKTIHAHTLSPTPSASLSASLLAKTATESGQITASASGFCLRVPVIFYHHVQPLDIAQKLGHKQLTVAADIFDKQMNYLVTSGYHIISAEQLVDALISHQQLPGKNIVVTLDDGYDDAYNYAFPIFKKYNIIGNLMIPSGLINNNGYLTWGQLKEMSSNPLIKITNHTWSHASLGGATKEKIDYELTTSNNQLQSELGQKINIFTYPYGSFSNLAIAELQSHGFIAGFTTMPGFIQCDSQIMILHRTRIGNAPLSAYGL